jgi:hypothetical protein
MNLFVVSNINQLYQAQALIRKNDLNQNVLAILYTDLNTTILNYLLGSVDHSLFVKSEAVVLPNHPNKFTKRKLQKIRDGYEMLFNKYDIQQLYICSFESHYNYLKDIATEKGIKTILFEEGTATYKFLIEDETEEPSFKKRLKRALWISKNDFKRSFTNSLLYEFIKRSFVIQSIVSFFKMIKRIAASLFTKEQRISFKSSLYPSNLRSAFKTIDEFDELYVAFPDKAKLIFKAKQYKELISDFHLNEETTALINESKTLSSVNSNSVIFVNQRYSVPTELHVRTILSFLKENYDNEKIFVKFHPKDSAAMKEAFLKGIHRMNLDVEIIELDIEVPFEAILKVKKPKEVIGISSTSLIYTEKLNPSTVTVSCANYYLKSLVRNRVDSKVIDLITFHKKILETLSDMPVK